MPSPAESLHLLIADVTLPLPEGVAQTAPPPLPQLEALLRHLRPQETIACAPDDPDTPLERALAGAHGLPGVPGRVPWAAFESGTTGVPCAWFHPCHWQMGMDHVRLLEPGRLNLDETQSRALLATLQPLMHEDGLALRYVRPDAWLAQGELLRNLSTWSMRRASREPLAREALTLTSDTAQGARLRRLHAEWQMLLHQHPVNDAREQAGQWSVNALWIDGAGVLEHRPAPAGAVRVETALTQAGEDPEARRAAWQAIDTGSVAHLRQLLMRGGDPRLTLCGAYRARTGVPGRGAGFRISSLFRPWRLADLPEQL